MYSTTCLPLHVLESKCRDLSQHQVIEPAPPHSKFSTHHQNKTLKYLFTYTPNQQAKRANLANGSNIMIDLYKFEMLSPSNSFPHLLSICLLIFFIQIGKLWSRKGKNNHISKIYAIIFPSSQLLDKIRREILGI